MDLTQKIKAFALELGFSRVGITGIDYLQQQADALETRKDNYPYFIEGLKLIEGCDPKNIMPEGKSIISLAYDFSRYDYPKKMIDSIGRAYLSRAYSPRKNTIHWVRLQKFKDFLLENNIKVAESRITLSDRLVAAKAGVATFGKNNFAFMNGGSSFVQLYSLVVDVKLEQDKATLEVRCPPDCHKCIDSCPTKALYADNKLNPQHCIAYYNCFTQDGIHSTTNSYIPHAIRPILGVKIHGCDICQEVCPRNQGFLKKAKEKDDFIENLVLDFDLEKVLTMDEAYYEKVIKPITYNYIRDRKYLQRNAAIAIGNTHDEKYLPHLKATLVNQDSMIREYIIWAIKNIDKNDTHQIIKQHREIEKDANVMAEMNRL